MEQSNGPFFAAWMKVIIALVFLCSAFNAGVNVGFWIDDHQTGREQVGRQEVRCSPMRIPESYVITEMANGDQLLLWKDGEVECSAYKKKKPQLQL